MKELLDKYQDFTLHAATCPIDVDKISSPEALDYLSLALGEETGEVLGKFKKNIRDNNGIYTDEFKIGLAAELGDCFYYISQISNSLGLILKDLVCFNAIECMSKKDPNNKNIARFLFHDANKIMEYIHIHINGGYNVVSIYESIMPYIGELVILANNIGYSLEEIIEGSMAKVRSRVERGVVSGSGDDR